MSVKNVTSLEVMKKVTKRETIFTLTSPTNVNNDRQSCSRSGSEIIVE